MYLPNPSTINLSKQETLCPKIPQVVVTQNKDTIGELIRKREQTPNKSAPPPNPERYRRAENRSIYKSPLIDSKVDDGVQRKQCITA